MRFRARLAAFRADVVKIQELMVQASIATNPKRSPQSLRLLLFQPYPPSRWAIRRRRPTRQRKSFHSQQPPRLAGSHLAVKSRSTIYGVRRRKRVGREPPLIAQITR